MFSDEEIGDAEDARARAEGEDMPHTDDTWRKGVAAIMTKAAELLAVRGGTMTKEQLRYARDSAAKYGDEHHLKMMVFALHRHAVTQGARVAVLEKALSDAAARDWTCAYCDAQFAEPEPCRAHAQTCEKNPLVARIVVLEKEQHDIAVALGSPIEPGLPAFAEALREQLDVANESVRELTRRAQQAEAHAEEMAKTAAKVRKVADQWRADNGVDVWRKRVEAAAAELADVGSGEFGRLDIVGKVKALKERLATATRPLTWMEELARAHDAEMRRTGEHADRAEVVNTSKCYCSLNDEAPCFAERHPCSPTCTHDDAAKPGHPERVKERSGAMRKAALLDYGRQKDDWRPADADAYDAGAEAMRSACLEAAQRVGQTLALGPTEMEMLKSAIEGAAP